MWKVKGVNQLTNHHIWFLTWKLNETSLHRLKYGDSSDQMTCCLRWSLQHVYHLIHIGSLAQPWEGIQTKKFSKMDVHLIQSSWSSLSSSSWIIMNHHESSWIIMNYNELYWIPSDGIHHGLQSGFREGLRLGCLAVDDVESFNVLVWQLKWKSEPDASSTVLVRTSWHWIQGT